MVRLDSPVITNESVRIALSSGDVDASMHSAMAAAALAVTDIGVIDLAAGRLEEAIARFQQGLRLDPTCRSAFHNLVCALLSAGQFRGTNFDAVRSHLLTHWGDLSWRDDYRHLFALPKFLNLEFVRGKCNLKCRMCIGTNSAAHPDRLTAITVEDFEQMLTAAPTIAGVTLSSGDSDPLLHPKFVEIIETAARRGVRVDLYTNGLPLSAKSARAIVSSGAVSMINFSIDAATPTTYAEIRGGDFDKLLSKIGMLSEMKRATGGSQPLISFSFVAMRDNIHELPEFIELAARHQVGQVIVDDLSGWMQIDGGNFPATDHADCRSLLEAARRDADRHDIRLAIHERLREIVERETVAVRRDSEMKSEAPLITSKSIAAHLHDVTAELADGRVRIESGLACCGWIDGVWVGTNGSLHPCCMVQGVADMGRVQDGPLHENLKYRHVKDALLSGRVFKACRSQRMCAYVQQQEAKGVSLKLIDGADSAHRVAAGTFEAYDSNSTDRSSVALPILN